MVGVFRPVWIAGVVACLCATFLASSGAAASSDLKLHRIGAQDRGLSSQSSGQTRIVGGNFTTSSKYPWQASLAIFSGLDEFLCGASLIHPLIVITAAHCLYDEDGDLLPFLEVFVLLGDTDLIQGNDVHEGVAVLGAGYDPEANSAAPNANDLALLVFDGPSALPRIQIAGLDQRALWTAGREAFVTGWGATSEGGEVSETLKEAMVPIIDDGTCAHPGIYGGFGFDPRQMVCAGYLAGGQDTCQGDSGGPLQREGRRVIRWASPAGASAVPAGQARCLHTDCRRSAACLHPQSGSLHRAETEIPTATQRNQRDRQRRPATGLRCSRTGTGYRCRDRQLGIARLRASEEILHSSH